MEMFLGETVEFWIRVRAAMRKANISTPADLEDRLQVTPPIYDVVERDGRWEIVARRPKFGQEVTVGWGASKDDAKMIAFMLAKKAA